MPPGWRSSGCRARVGRPVAGLSVTEREGTPLPERVLDSIRENGVALKGPLGTPTGCEPGTFDVLLLPNQYGDIVSDLCAGLVGGRGVAPGADLGAGCAVFEATHGTADRYRGLHRANPMALMLSGAMLLRHLGETEAGDRLEAAVAGVVAEGKFVTADLKLARDDPTAATTAQVRDAVVARLAA